MRGLTGPALVITVGILLLLSQVQGGNLSFGNTWPIILLVIGVLQLASSVASREGHIEPPAVGVPPVPPVNQVPPPPQAPLGNQGQ